MKKQIVILAVCLLVAVALGGALWFLMGYEPEGSSSSPIPEVDESLRLNQRNISELDTLQIQNETGSYTIRYLGDSQYTIEELEKAELNVSMLSSAASPAASLTATSLVTETPENLGDFGLDKPRVTFSARYTDGSEFVLELGNDAPGGNGVYGKVKGTDPVYQLSSYSFGNTFKGMLEYVNTTITEPPSGNTETLPDKISLGGVLRPETLVIERNDNTTEEEKNYSLNLYKVTAPKDRAVDSDDAVNALTSLLSITAESVAAYDPDADQLKKFGLDTPYSTADFSYQDEEENRYQVSLLVSEPDAEGYAYLMRGGVPLVYRVKTADLPWYEMTYGDFIATLQLLPHIDSISEIKVESPSKSYTFHLEGEGDEMKVTSGGQTLEDKPFRQYYQTLIGLPSEEFTEDPAPDESQALLKVTFTYRDSSKKPDYIALLPGPTRKLFLSVNGESEFYTKASYLDTILQNSEKLLAGENVDPLY